MTPSLENIIISFMSEHKDRLIGYSNPKMDFPSSLVAIVSNSEGHFSVYPGGHREKCPVHPEEAPDFVKLSKNIRYLYRWSEGKDNMLYGISPTHILIGETAFIVRRLGELTAKMNPRTVKYKAISEHVNKLIASLPTSQT